MTYYSVHGLCTVHAYTHSGSRGGGWALKQSLFFRAKSRARFGAPCVHALVAWGGGESCSASG